MFSFFLELFFIIFFLSFFHFFLTFFFPQKLGGKNVFLTFRSADAYAFGILMWELWAGCSAYEGVPTATVFYRVAIEGGRPGPLPGQEGLGEGEERSAKKER